MDIFFKEYLHHQTQINKLLLDEDFKRMVRKFFRERIDMPFCGVSILSTYFDTSESTFKRLFKKHFNTTPLHYFKTMQIEAAKKQLKSGKYTVAEVSRNLGFSSPGNFIRTYKQNTGITPKQYLKT